MVGGIILLVISGFLAHALVNRLKRTHPSIETTWLKRLFYYHVVLSFIYYLYSLFNASDSRYYFRKVVENYRGPEWFDFYGTSTTFIEFISYPFIRYLGFSYHAMMALFAFFGYLGFVYFYIFFKENVKFRHTLFGFDLIKIFLLLPNFHFWSGSMGKGAIIFPAIAFFFYGITKLEKRVLITLVTGIIIYHVRPHIMLVMLVSCFVGFVFSTKGINWIFRLLFIVGAGIAFFYIYQDVLTMVGIDQDELLTQGFGLSHRAYELSKASSGINISNYSLGLQLFTFIYRPLFFDAPGLLGLIVSFENVFYLLITLRLLRISGIKFLFTCNFLVKSALFSFLTVSLALAQVSGNLGMAIRQKSQVMMLFLFVIIMFMDKQKQLNYDAFIVQRIRKKKLDNSLKKQMEAIHE